MTLIKSLFLSGQAGPEGDDGRAQWKKCHEKDNSHARELQSGRLGVRAVELLLGSRHLAGEVKRRTSHALHEVARPVTRRLRLH